MSASPAQQRRVTILGSTGSIGCNTAELLAADRETYAVEALVASKNALRLAEQAKSLQARFAVVADESQYRALKEALAGSGIDLWLEVPPDVAIEAKTFGGDVSASGLRAGAKRPRSVAA